MIEYDEKQDVVCKREGDKLILGKQMLGLTMDQFHDALCQEILRRDEELQDILDQAEIEAREHWAREEIERQQKTKAVAKKLLGGEV